MASVLRYLLVIASIHSVKSDCHSPLGMQNKKITDKQINASHWLYHTKITNKHYMPQFARLNLKSSSGAWCSEGLYDHRDQYIQIDLLLNKKITGIATQGRFGSSEYTEEYQVMYQRDKENIFRKYNESGKTWKKFKGNSDNNTTVTNTLKRPIIARKLRIYPRGAEHAIYCLRLELYGCRWRHRSNDLVSYSAPLGAKLKGIDTKDYAYDGLISKYPNIVSGGLGKLSDDIYGNRYLTNDRAGLSSPWVAYNTRDPIITFKFHKKRLIKKVMIHVKNNGDKIHIFRYVYISMSENNRNYSLVKKYTTNDEQTNKRGSIGIIVHFGEVLTKYIRIKFVKRSHWLLLSEILFFSDDYPSKHLLPDKTVKNTAQTVNHNTKSKKDLLDSDSPTKLGGSSKGLSFPIILTITLVTSAIFIILTIVIYKSYVNKQSSHVTESRTVPAQQAPAVDKQAVSLLYDSPRMKIHKNLVHQVQGMYMQSNMQSNIQPFNPKGLIS